MPVRNPASAQDCTRPAGLCQRRKSFRIQSDSVRFKWIGNFNCSRLGRYLSPAQTRLGGLADPGAGTRLMTALERRKWDLLGILASIAVVLVAYSGVAFGGKTFD